MPITSVFIPLLIITQPPFHCRINKTPTHRVNKMTNQRQRCIAGCLLATTVLLASALGAVAQEGASGEDTDLDTPFNTVFTEWSERVNYTSSTHFQVRGMEPFYNVTNMILRWFEPEPTIPDGKQTFTFQCTCDDIDVCLNLYFTWKSRPLVRISLHNWQSFE